MTPEEAIAEARAAEAGKAALRPVYLLVGPEQLLCDQALTALRRAADVEKTWGFNAQRIHAGDASAEAVVTAARTVPMMANRRLVVVSGLDRWDKDKREGGERSHPLDVLADYCARPCDSTLLLLCASALNGSRRIMRIAKKEGFVVSCEPLRRHELPGWIVRSARSHGHAILPAAAEALAELCGPDLGSVQGALERLSLYVGPGAAIDEAAVAEIISRVRLDDVWKLVDAVGARDLPTALAALGDVAQGRDEGPRLLGAIGSRVRQLLKFSAARRAGQPAAEAARLAGVPPFRAAEVDRAVSRIGPAAFERWLGRMAEADLALKGDKRGAQDVLAAMVLAMCAAGGAQSRRE